MVKVKNYIELSIYLKFTENDGATTDVTFKLMSGSSTAEQVVLELDDPRTEGGGFGGIGGGSCSCCGKSNQFRN